MNNQPSSTELLAREDAMQHAMYAPFSLNEGQMERCASLLQRVARDAGAKVARELADMADASFQGCVGRAEIRERYPEAFGEGRK